MKQDVERIAPRLYRRTYETADGGESVLYYARFVCKLKGKRREFAVGGDVKKAKESVRDFEYRNRHMEDFDATKRKPEQVKQPQQMTVESWSAVYLEMEETKAKRSYEREKELVKPINRILGPIPLTDIKRDHLFGYRKQRLAEPVIRAGKPAKRIVEGEEVDALISPGTVANELSCLRHMLRKASEEGIAVSIPSFKGLIVRSQRDRVLEDQEEKALLDEYPRWLKWLCEAANETCLSQGDIVRLNRFMIDRRRREIVPTGGRVKTGVDQRAPLTDRMIEILDEIEKAKRRGEIKPNEQGLIFARDDGRAITKDMITTAIRNARKRAGVTDFRFHDYRHCAQTRWAREGVHVDVAMKAAGHKSVAMHQRYVNLKAGDVAAGFGLKMVGNVGGQNQSDDEQARASS